MAAGWWISRHNMCDAVPAAFNAAAASDLGRILAMFDAEVEWLGSVQRHWPWRSRQGGQWKWQPICTRAWPGTLAALRPQTASHSMQVWNR